MAKANNNIFVRGLTGSVSDQFVMRSGRGGETIVSNKPGFSGERQFNQREHQETFRRAILYAQTVKDEELYIKKAVGTNMTLFNAAMADYFKKPQILEIDASEWQGNPGKTIWVQALDDTLVTTVYVTISDETGAVSKKAMLSAPPARGGGTWHTPRPHVVATASDMPGHSAELAWQS